MIEPTHDRVIVRPAETETMSTGEHVDPDVEGEVHLHLVEEAQEKPSHGEVLAIGPDVTSCRVGDEVWYSRYTGDTIDVDGEDLLFIKDGDTIGIEKGEAWEGITMTVCKATPRT